MIMMAARFVVGKTLIRCRDGYHLRGEGNGGYILICG